MIIFTLWPKPVSFGAAVTSHCEGAAFQFGGDFTLLSSFSFSLYAANDVQTVDSLMQWLEVEARNRGKSHLESTHIEFVWKILSKELN